MIQYILECIAFQLVFLVIYDFILKRETFFQWNRAYLLGTFVLSMILPWIKIEALKATASSSKFLYPEFLWQRNDMVAIVSASDTPSTFSWDVLLITAGMVMATLYLGFKMYQLYRLRQRGKVTYFERYTRIFVTNSHLAFSFFKSIYLGDKVLERDYTSIIEHELVHIEQRHTYDLLFFELMSIVGWFNPLVYVYQNRIAEVHEFIADAHVAKFQKRESYELLLSQVFQTESFSFINQFFKSSLLKKRIVMLQKSRSRQIWKLKYLALVPMLLTMLFYTSCENDLGEPQGLHEELAVENIEYLTQEEEGKVFTRLIDLSVQEQDWSLKIVDKNSSLLFTRPGEGSYISGPGNVNIKARMQIDSKILDENFDIFNRDNTETLQITFADNYIPFGVIENVPVFPGCENAVDKRACFNEKMQQHISKNFRYPQKAQELGIEGRVNAMFLINETGEIREIKTRGPDKLLEDEVIRIISRLPRMEPGNAKGKPVNVPYSIPITYKLQQAAFNNIAQDEAYKKIKTEHLGQLDDAMQLKFQNAVPFATVDKAPIFPGCEDANDGRVCFYEKIQNHIKKHFNYPREAQEKGVQGRVNLLFLIQADGTIGSIATKGPDKLLEDEAVRIISRLPHMEPGYQDGKAVAVPFSIPITFKLK